MSAIVSNIRKSENFSSEKPFVVIVFHKESESVSKIAKAALTEGGAYSLTYNLQLLFPECMTDENTFDENAAYKRFKEVIKVGDVEPVNCFDIPISEISDGAFEAVKVVTSGRVMQTMRPAVYGDRVDALRIAKNSLDRQIKKKTLKVFDLSKSTSDDYDE